MRICFYSYTYGSYSRFAVFAPLYNGNSNVRLHAGHLAGDKYDLHGIIGTMLMKDPVFQFQVLLLKKLVHLMIIVVVMNLI